MCDDITLYLHEAYYEYSSVMAAPQLTITPTSGSFTVRAISIKGWSSTDGTCTSSSGSTYTMDNGSGSTVVLLLNHAYVTTDDSNFALNNATTAPTGKQRRDQTYTLLDNNLASLATTCIQGSGSVTCNSSTDCGWNSARTWNP